MKTLFITLTAAFALMTASPAADAPYRHVVFFKFKESATREQVQSIEKAFAELAKKVETVKGFEWGTNVSPEGLNDGFTHCFLVTFADKAGLEVYLPHPEHDAFVAKLKPLLDKVCVVDYVAK
jgi:quinol monooxygenase YgiN